MNDTNPRDLDANGIAAALRENDQRRYGRERTLIAEELVAAAERIGELPLLVAALLDLMGAYTFGAEQKSTPIAFARVLKLWDTHPEAFDEWSEHQVFWQFKWVAAALLDIPDVPLATIRHWADEMGRRYAAQGLGAQAVHHTTYTIASHIGLGVDEAFAAWTGAPRDSMSNCRACEAHTRGKYHRAHGDDERALAEWRPVLEGQLRCAEEPHHVKASALLPLVRLGRLDEARAHHLTGYRMARGNDNLMAAIGRHLEFCALTHNEARGLELLAQHRNLFGVIDNPLDHLEFLTGVRVLLARLADIDRGDLSVAGPAGRSWTVGALLADVADRSDALARRFDQRNGTTAVGDRLTSRLACRPLLDEPLPLGVRVATLASASRSGTDQAEDARDRRTDESTIVDASGIERLIEQARAAHQAVRPDAGALWARIARLLARNACVSVDDLLRGEMAEARAGDAAAGDRFDEARAAYEAASDFFERAGAHGRAATVRVRAAYAHLLATGAASTARQSFEAAVESAMAEHAAGRANDEQLLTVRRLRAYAYAQLLRVEGAGVSLDGLRADVDVLVKDSRELGPTHQVVSALAMRANLHATGGDFDAATADAREALAIVEDSGQPWLAMGTYTLLARIELTTHQFEAAREHLNHALALAREWHDEHFPYADTLVLLARASGGLGDVADAVSRLAEAADRFERAGNAAAALANRVDLAGALRGSGRAGEAVSVMESALDSDQDGAEAEGSEVPEPIIADARLELARCLKAVGERRAAAQELLRLANMVARWPNQGAHTQVACETAVALAEAGMWPEARLAYQRAFDAHGVAARPAKIMEMMRGFATAAMTTLDPTQLVDGQPTEDQPTDGRLPEDQLTDADHADEDAAPAEGAASAVLSVALDYLTAATEFCARTPDEDGAFCAAFETGLVHDARARVYLDAEDYESAFAEAARASDALGQAPGAERARAEADRLAALIEARGLGRDEPARERLTAAIARTAAAGHADAAAILSELRDSLAASATE